MISRNTSFPKKLSKIDKLLLPDHHFLDETDSCFFFGEYTARKLSSYSDTNDLIINFKKPISRKDSPGWRYKKIAIRKAADAVGSIFHNAKTSNLTFVPIPPSKLKTNPEYDDRVLKTLNLAFHNTEVDVREAISLTEDRYSFHSEGGSRNIDALIRHHSTNLDMIESSNEIIVLFDDVITTGCSFRAHKKSITDICPNKKVVGVFLARRVPESDDFATFFDE